MKQKMWVSLTKLPRFPEKIGRNLPGIHYIRDVAYADSLISPPVNNMVKQLMFLLRKHRRWLLLGVVTMAWRLLLQLLVGNLIQRYVCVSSSFCYVNI
ncbi:uncharacterized protein LOC114276530 isoform X1 [Camellia sinensis]|uniref:uncharacterized protein LOC114276530 isoform X1 n=1 Tax=Camellia sinensis TaxID=4442 RepID=UPI0010356695|nr:uncharacterized protein LOC114276530 isoform X1 [Camellia sinensis]